MRPEDFDFLSKLIKSRSGLVLTPDKAYLLESRLMPIVRKRGMKALEDLIGQLRLKRDEALLTAVTEAMTTNESFFFRDSKPFDQFRDIVMAHILKARAAQKSLRIWCAAASSGQEPYSICMVLKEMEAKLKGWKIEIIGTDISSEILAKAKAGLYTQFEVQRGLPIRLMVKYFAKKEDMWQIDPAIRSMVTYREFNLLDNMRALGKFDVVFCRNVLIYFDQPTKSEVLRKISAQMPDDGFLYLGGAETVLGISDKFKALPGQRGIYLLNRSGAPDIKALSVRAASGADKQPAPAGTNALRPRPGSGAARPGMTARTGSAARPVSTSAATTRPAGGIGTARPGITRPGSTGSSANNMTRPGTSSSAGTARPARPTLPKRPTGGR